MQFSLSAFASVFPPSSGCLRCVDWPRQRTSRYVNDDMLPPSERVTGVPTDGCHGLSNVNKCNDKRASLDYCVFETME